jgi:hypothetical protein
MPNNPTLLVDLGPRELSEPGLGNTIREIILTGRICLIRNFIPSTTLDAWRCYLSQVGGSSLPNYQPIHLGCLNFHRVKHSSHAGYGKGSFHQFCFFPWNQDVLALFDAVGPVYSLMNEINRDRRDRFLCNYEEEKIARLSFQYYPRGVGQIEEHADPTADSLSVAILMMSKKGVTFREGGGYVIGKNDDKVNYDNLTSPGDLIIFGSATRHGVEVIDPGSTQPWLSFEGRWILLFDINSILPARRTGRGK